MKQLCRSKVWFWKVASVFFCDEKQTQEECLIKLGRGKNSMSLSSPDSPCFTLIITSSPVWLQLSFMIKTHHDSSAYLLQSLWSFKSLIYQSECMLQFLSVHSRSTGPTHRFMSAQGGKAAYLSAHDRRGSASHTLLCAGAFRHAARGQTGFR